MVCVQRHYREPFNQMFYNCVAMLTIFPACSRVVLNALDLTPSAQPTVHLSSVPWTPHFRCYILH